MLVINLLVLIFVIINFEACEAGLRVFGGRDALKDEFPFVVRLERKFTVKKENGQTEVKYYKFCTGAALTLSWTLTAAHCYDKNVISTSFVRYNSYLPKELGVLSPILNGIIHPGYLTNEYVPMNAVTNDVALIQTKNITVSFYGRISVIEFSSMVGLEVVALGFGLTNSTSSDTPLQVLNGILIKCDSVPSIPMLCIAPPCGRETKLCPGDSGGPVVHSSGIVGVNSQTFGKMCAVVKPGYTSGIIAMLGPVVDWLSKTISD